MADEDNPEAPTSTVRALPVRVGPARLDREQTYQYWPFSTSDLYNWKTQAPSFSEKPQGLIDLLEFIFFTHNPTWDDCQQLLQVLFTTEEREQILSEARKNVPGVDGRPTTQPNLIDEGFPLTQPHGTSSTLKVGSVSECTARLLWLDSEQLPGNQRIWQR